MFRTISLSALNLKPVVLYALLACILSACGLDGTGNSSSSASSRTSGPTPAPSPVAAGVITESLIIHGTPLTSIVAGTPYRYVPSVSGANPQQVTFSIVNKPAWARFEATTGALSGTPTSADAGATANIVIGATDGAMKAQVGPFSINVIAPTQPQPTKTQTSPPPPPSPPTITGNPATTVSAGSNYSFTPVASDSSNALLTFSIQNVPSWARFNSSTGQLSGTPQAANVGAYPSILITVSDGNGSASLPPFTIDVKSAAVPTPAQALLSYLQGLTGRGILSGQYADLDVPGMMDQVPLITSQTGKTPAILGVYLSLGSATFNADPVTLANQWLAKGGIVIGMLSPGNPTYSANIIGGITQSIHRPKGHPVNFGNLLIPGTIEYTRWQAFLAQLVSEFKAINGPIIVRPFPELNSDWKWWGDQPPAQLIAVWQQLVTYVRNAGVTNVLWCFNIGATALPAGYPDLGAVVRAYYPGDAYVDIVSMDSYPPSAANGAGIAALTATGKPVIYSELGAVKGPGAVPEFSGDTSAALDAIIANYPQVVAAVVWGGTEALPVQNGMVEFMNNPKIVNLSDLPQGF